MTVIGVSVLQRAHTVDGAGTSCDLSHLHDTTVCRAAASHLKTQCTVTSLCGKFL